MVFRTMAVDLFYITLQSDALKKLFLFFLLVISFISHSQIQASLATDVTLLRNFSPDQKFWAFGQTIRGDFHFSKRESGYASLVYYSPGNFHNFFLATAKSSQTIPNKVSYYVGSEWRMRQVSLGWKHFFRGSFDEENRWNLYGIAGLGLVFTKTLTNYIPIDSSLYDSPGVPLLGKGEFKRLTLDLGVGFEIPLGGNFFAYGEAKTWLRASDYPSPYLHNNKNVPLPAIINSGLRILFGY